MLLAMPCLINSQNVGDLSIARIGVPRSLKVVDANGQSLAYVYSREDPREAQIANVLTEHEARRIAANIAKLPTVLVSFLG